MSNDQGERIQANCRIIWGEGDYDLDIYADDYEYYSCWVKRDFGLSFGPPLTGTGLCSSPEKAWNEFDRMLREWAQSVKNGKPMTKEEQLSIFSGPNGEHRALLETVDAFMAAYEGKL